MAAGLGLILHGLAHAVFALRGSAAWRPTPGGSHAFLILYSTALVMFVAAGIGLMGLRLFHPRRIPLIVAGTTASVPALDERRFAARTGQGLALVFFAYAAAGAFLWPWHRSWGTTDADWRLALPGDPPVRSTATESMHGISIDAPDWVVWAWLVQIGQDRAGFYSYDGLERLFGARIRNADELRPDWQQRHAGDRIPATGGGYLGGMFGEQPGWNVTHDASRHQAPRRIAARTDRGVAMRVRVVTGARQ